MKKCLLLCMVILLSLLTACSNPQPIKTIGSSKYYVKVQNNGEKYTEQDNTRYKYKLSGFNEDGKGKKFTFTSNHRLKQGAYLRIYSKEEEVITYEEVKQDGMPKKAQQMLGSGNES